jgi:hypothetical protein
MSRAPMTPFERFHEWLLSDHPAAIAERARRRAAARTTLQRDLATLRAFVARTDANPHADAAVARLAATARGRLLPRIERELAELAQPDAVRVSRECFEAARRADDPDYRYPTCYLGLAAIRQPIVPDPHQQHREVSS